MNRPAGAGPIHIAHVHSARGLYGAERWTLALIANLDLVRFRTTVITIGDGESTDAVSLRARDLGHGGVHLPSRGRPNRAVVASLRRAIISNEIDIVHTHGYKSDILGCLATLALPVGWITTAHGISAAEGLRVRTYEAIARRFWGRCDRILSVSGSLTNRLLAKGVTGRQLRTVPDGVDLDEFGEAANERLAPSCWPLRIVYVGRLNRVKRVADLIEAFALLGDDRASLTVVGDGPEMSRLVDQVANSRIGQRTTFTGAIDDVRGVLSTANVLVLPSVVEGMPRVIMEAFAAGLVVIGTDVAGIRDLVAHLRTGLLVPVGRPHHIASALRLLRDNPGLVRQMVEEARKLVRQNHSAVRLAADVGDEYESLWQSRLH